MNIDKHLIAIDPATRYLGIAYFINGVLKETKTFSSKGKDRQGRQHEILTAIMDWFNNKDVEVDSPLEIACEEPTLRGTGNNSMQRILGGLEALFTVVSSPPVYFNYISPMTVKARMGHGSLDKLEVALAAGKLLETEEEREMVAEIVAHERFDESDAVAVGLCYLYKGIKNA